MPRAKGIWALDSGGFSELSLHGEWSITVKQYIQEVRRYLDCIGKMAWAASCDYMCEPDVLKKTGLTVAKHQELTIDKFLEARNLAPELPIMPVVQGYTWADYHYHLDEYARRGVDLSMEPVVGVGTICRRSGTLRAGAIMATLKHDLGDRLHAFGWKIRGLLLNQEHVHSADSLAWSYRARRSPPLPECDHPNCNSCLRYALRWRAKLLKLLGLPNTVQEPPIEMRLF